MTQAQFEDIRKKLAQWRENRGLSVEDQWKNFKDNFGEELDEFIEAKSDNKEYEMVDALCDMVVVAVNAGLEYREDYPPEDDFNIIHLVIAAAHTPINPLIWKIERMGYDPYLCLLETIKELESRTGAWSEKECKWIKDIGAYNKEEAWEKAKDMQKSLDTNATLFFSRETDSEWIFALKGHKPIAIVIKKWYRADYSKCKKDMYENL